MNSNDKIQAILVQADTYVKDIESKMNARLQALTNMDPTTFDQKVQELTNKIKQVREQQDISLRKPGKYPLNSYEINHISFDYAQQTHYPYSPQQQHASSNALPSYGPFLFC